VRELNLEAARIARRVADEFTAREPHGRGSWRASSAHQPHRSLSPDAQRPGYRAVTFDELAAAYGEQAEALLDGGADLLMVETVFDTLNCKAALFAVRDVIGPPRLDVPLMVSGTITDKSGGRSPARPPRRSGTRSATPGCSPWDSTARSERRSLRPYVEELSRIADIPVSCHPKRGAAQCVRPVRPGAGRDGGGAGEFAERGFLNIVAAVAARRRAHRGHRGCGRLPAATAAFPRRRRIPARRT